MIWIVWVIVGLFIWLVLGLFVGLVIGRAAADPFENVLEHELANERAALDVIVAPVTSP